MSILKMRKQRENEQKREALSKWLASFTVTAVVAVTVVIIRSNPPTADLAIQAVGDEIVYRADVQDPDQKITIDTLVLSISNPYESYEESISLGLTMGTFLMERPHTDYKVSVKASLGYGLETLATQTVTSRGELAGAIANAYLDPSIDLSLQPYSLNYFIRTIYDDPRQELSGVTLYYDYVPTAQLEESSSSSSHSSEWSSQPPVYAYVPSYIYSMPITATDQESIIYEIPNWNYTVFLRLVGTKTIDQSEVILDEMSFTTPFNINASFYLSDLGSDYAKVYIYPPEYQQIDVQFSVALSQEGHTLETTPVVFHTETVSEGGGYESSAYEYTYQWAEITFDGLETLSFYTVDLYAQYIDPNTSQTVNRAIRTIEFTTFPEHTYTVSYVENIQSYEFTITVNDPSFVFQSIYYNVFDMSTPQPQYLAYGDFMTQDQGAIRTYTALIPKPGVPSYQISISANKAFEANSFYGCFLYALDA